MIPATRTASTAERVLVDTGLLVSLYARDDPYHLRAHRWVGQFAGELLTVGSVLAETAWLLPARDRGKVAHLAANGAVKVRTPDARGYARIAQLLAKYADIDPDWADVELVWLAEASGVQHIATLDVADFGIYRLHGRRAFQIVWPR